MKKISSNDFNEFYAVIHKVQRPQYNISYFGPDIDGLVFGIQKHIPFDWPLNLIDIEDFFIEKDNDIVKKIFTSRLLSQSIVFDFMEEYSFREEFMFQLGFCCQINKNIFIINDHQSKLMLDEMMPCGFASEYENMDELCAALSSKINMSLIENHTISAEISAKARV